MVENFNFPSPPTHKPSTGGNKSELQAAHDFYREGTALEQKGTLEFALLKLREANKRF